jgi:hypothetical protein
VGGKSSALKVEHPGQFPAAAPCPGARFGSARWLAPGLSLPFVRAGSGVLTTSLLAIVT